VHTLVDLRFENIVRQGFDVSCGAAALATLLTHYLNRPIEEKPLIDSILATSSEEDKVNIAKLGFSMLELKRAGERMGLQSGGFRVDDVSKLLQLKVPAITLVNISGYRHFVVIKGVSEDRIFLADPAFGNRSRSLASFAREWNSVILVFVDPNQPGNNQFVLKGMPRGPADRFMSVLDQGLQHFTATPMPGEF
jgi:predicted double-glycine peptidase